MAKVLRTLTRRLVGNRRRHPRQRRRYDTVVRNQADREVFRGTTLDISRSGARVRGYVAGIGVFRQQPVTVEFLLVPKDVTKVAARAPVHGRIVRVQESDDDTVVAVAFDRPLPE